MVHSLCDFCGLETGNHGMLLSITPFNGFARYHGDTKPMGTNEKSANFVICSDCHTKRNLPNPYMDYSRVTNQKLHYEKVVKPDEDEKQN